MGWNRQKEVFIDNNPDDPDFYKPHMVVKKNTFINIIKNPLLDSGYTFGNILVDALDRTNKIVFHVYNFLELFIIHSFDNNLKCPIIDKNFIKNIICTITARTETRGKKPSENSQSIIESLKKFYEAHYKPMLIPNEIISDHKLSYILNYEQVDIIKNINNNIKEHYADHIRHFVNIYFDLDGIIKQILKEKISDAEKKAKIKVFRDTFYKVKTDLLNVSGEEYLSDNKYHDWINKHKKLFIPKKQSYEKNSVCYDVCVHPTDYIYPLIRLNREIDALNKEIISKHVNIKENIIDKFFENGQWKTSTINNHPKIHKLFHILPLRTQIAPKYITLDTASLISLFIKKDNAYYLKNMKLLEQKIWNKFFHLKNKVFKRPGYKFHHMIKTDGVACSVLFVKTDCNGDTYKKPIDKLNEFIGECIKVKYIEDVQITDQMKRKRIVTIDPGKNDLIECMALTDPSMVGKEHIYENANGFLCNEIYKDVVTFRYTQRQRNHDTRKHKYAKIRLSLKKELIKGKSITEIESILSKYDSKTTNFKKFKEYLLTKIIINGILNEHYNKTIYRKLKWNTYINTQRSEDEMLNNFEKKFGNHSDVMIILGDYSEKSHKKGHEPTITKRIRKLFKNRLYETYLIDEFRTSKLCHKCEHETENFVHGVKKNREGVEKDRLIWKLIRCKAENCKSIHNRDLNATLNMMKITKAVMEGKERPKNYKRKEPGPVEPQVTKKVVKPMVKNLVKKKVKDIIVI